MFLCLLVVWLGLFVFDGVGGLGVAGFFGGVSD